MPAQLTTRDGRRPDDLEAAFGPGPWLVVAPHDDDAVIGCGLAIIEAARAGIAVHIAVVSDGRMGWFEPADAADLVERREREMRESVEALGLGSDRLHLLGFPDGSLSQHRGTRPESEGTGIGRALTRVMREVRPGAVFCPTGEDLHPDHRITAEECAMAVAWASGPQWRELGEPIDAPRSWDYAVYCDFPAPPELQLRSDDAAMDAKIEAMRRFVSQPFIMAMVDRLVEDGPVEYFAASTWRPYRPAHYANFFTAEVVHDGQFLFAADCAMVVEALADWRPWDELAAAMAEPAPLVLVGEGSSRLFPAAFARHLLRRLGCSASFDSCGGRAAERVDWQRCRALLSSNSGGTRELVELYRRGGFAHQPLALLGLGDGALAREVAAHRAVLPRAETAVAATASVALQALTLGAAVAAAADATVPLEELRDGFRRVLEEPVPSALHRRLKGATRLWWADPEVGVADELALKTLELCGLPGIAAPGTLALHGCEEIFAEGDRVVWFAPDPRDAELIARVETTTTTPVIDVLAEWKLPDLGEWSPLLWLAAGWRLLAGLADDLGRDPTRAERARKIGNPLAEES